MKNIFKIFRLLIDEKNDFFKSGTNLKKSLFAFLKLFILISFTTIVLIVVVKKITILGIRLNNEMLSIVLLVTQVLSILMSLGSIISSLYMSKDSELLMCLPATHNQVFFAKLMVIYVNSFFSNLLYFLPIFLTFGILGNMGFLFYLLLPVFLLTLPILSMVIAAFLSVPVMLFIKFIKKNLFLLTAVMLALVSVSLYYYIEFVGSLVSIIDIAGRQVLTVIKINNAVANFASTGNFLFYPIAKAMSGTNFFVVVPILLVVSLALLYVSTLLVKPFYFKIATSQLETSSKETLKKRKTKKESPLYSLLKKEALVIFRSPGYLFQYFIFTILMPFIVFVYDKLLLSITVSMAGEIMISGAHLLVLTILTALSTTISASAISREGGTYYIMKSTPVDYKTQTLAKVLFNIIVVFVAIVVTTIVSLIFININPLHIILSSLCAFLLAIGLICLSFDLDLRNPTLDWYDSSEISNVSKNTTNSGIIGLAISFLMAFVVFLFASSPFIWLALIVVSIFFAIGRIHLLRVRVNYYFKNTEI